MNRKICVIAAHAALFVVAACASNVDDQGVTDTATTEDGSTSTGDSTSEPGTTASASSTESGADNTETASSGDASSTGTTTTTSSSTDTEESSGSSSSSGTSESVCGDGILADGESCDDGNLEPEDACSTECEPQFYTGTGAPCDEDQLLPCQAVGAECRSLLVNGGGGAICYWPEYSGSETECNATAGVWTPHDDAFVEINELSVPEPGVCITHLTNMRCTANDEAVCSAAGADACFQYRLMSGGASDAPSICWWDASEVACEGTSGIWTSTESMFGMNSPNSIPPDADGACISQVTNLD